MLNVNYNPDVLSCLANLSNDEVFTPPKLVNEMLDMLPQDLFQNKETTFLDPVTKSGVFLREIAIRLNEGLKQQIPDQQERINHIFTKQLYGIAITELTSLLARRSTYCSKYANGDYSVCTDFENEQGNIKYERIQHTWQNGKCIYCGASESEYSRTDDLETYAYQFIHTDEPQNIFNMKFDVIIGNPPYQLSDGGGLGTSAMPIYQNFIQQAKKLKPKYMSMIVPARWYSGGKGLDDFRNEMINDTSIRQLHDFLDANEVFPGVQIKGGICYFLWDRDNKGKCNVHSYDKGEILSVKERFLKEDGTKILIRFNEAIDILNKVKSKNEETIFKNVSPRRPFGIDSNYTKFKNKKDSSHIIKLYRNGVDGFIRKSDIERGHDYLNKIKVIISKAGSGSDSFPHQIIGIPFISEPNSVCTETFIILRTFKTNNEAENFISYVKSKFFRFLVFLKKNTQNAARGVYEFVPIQDFNESWSDEKLYMKYGISDEEQNFIDKLIRPIE
ncbi:MAG: Eco57I restriction-modification methylase domain-containing protein [Flavobacteriaceae bacterium]